MIGAVAFAFLLLSFCGKTSQNEFCDVDDKGGGGGECGDKSSPLDVKYIFYDVNPPEGFNLRRDVYMRMAVFAKNLREQLNCYLVLPPWSRLYHWQSDVPHQSRLPWSLFFDVKSLQSFAPVIEMTEFFQTGIKRINQVFNLQHFQDTFTSGNFEDRFGVEPCIEKVAYKRVGDGYAGYFWGYGNITADKFDCLSFHGPVSQLIDVVKQSKARTIMFDHAEVALHDRFGDKTYWDARKSMRFARHLIDEARRFRAEHLNWTKDADDIPWPNPNRDAVGGSYLCVHMRRKDFLYGHNKNVPSIEGAANQIEKALDDLGLDTVFVATDAPEEERLELRSRLPRRRVVMYAPTREANTKWKDGGVAIIEQIICSHARQFIGTHESTFSFRIQEEREIMGFEAETTFKRLCGDREKKCRQPSRWKIVH